VTLASQKSSERTYRKKKTREKVWSRLKDSVWKEAVDLLQIQTGKDRNKAEEKKFARPWLEHGLKGHRRSRQISLKGTTKPHKI
jgi:hypothetical protein